MLRARMMIEGEKILIDGVTGNAQRPKRSSPVTFLSELSVRGVHSRYLLMAHLWRPFLSRPVSLSSFLFSASWFVFRLDMNKHLSTRSTTGEDDRISFEWRVHPL